MKLTTTLKALTVTAAMFVIMLAIPTNASASSIISHFDYPGITHLEDNDWEFTFTSDQDTILEIGETLVGMIQIQKLNHVDDPGTFTPVNGVDTTLTGIFFIEVATKANPAPGLYNFTFSAPDAAEYAALALALGLPARNSLDTVAFVYEDSTTPVYVDPAAAGINAALATAIDGKATWELGLMTGSTNMWSSRTDSDDITAITGFDFFASLNVTYYYPGALGLLPHNFLIPALFGDVQLKGGFEPLTGGAGANFQAQTDTDFYLKAVPEPSTITLLGLGLISAAFLSRKRLHK